MKKIPVEGFVGTQALREAAASEFGQVMALVRAALEQKLNPAGVMYVEIEAFYADRVVICRDGRYYSYAYTIGADNQVTLGDPQEVVEQYVPVSMREAVGSAACFVESTDAEGNTWDAVIVRAGESMNRTMYPDAVLREATPLFEGARVFAKSDADHIKGGGKDVRNIVGWISAPRFVEGKAGAADSGHIAGTFNFAAGAHALRDTVTDAWRRGKRDLVGLSIDAEGKARALREGAKRVATAITKVNSVDLIVEPSAGGGLVRLVEAAASATEEKDPMKERLLKFIETKAPAIFAKIDPAKITEEDLEARYAEALQVDQAAKAAAAKPAAAKPAATDTAGAPMTREELAAEVRMIEARAHARAAIAGCNLPQAAKDKLAADFGKRERFAEADVDAAIKGEREYIATFSESGHVRVPFDQVSVEDRSKKIGDMLDAFFDQKHKDHRSAQSFRECYIEVTGDARVTGRMENVDRARMAEAVGATFRESLDSTSFANVLGNSITRRMIADYREMGQWDVWRNACERVPLSDFRTQERTRFGGYGDLPIVAEKAPYVALASPTDEKATYAAAKRGGTEDVTLEMVKNDDVGAIRRIPIQLSRTAKRTLCKFVMDFVRTNPVLYDGVAFFHATHGNLGAAALDAVSLAAARLRMKKQAELNSAARISIGPRYLWVPDDLEEAAVNLFNKNTNLDKTFVQALSLTVMPVPYWTDANDWAISADVMDIPGIEVGFLDGQEEPELFVQDMPSVGSMFTNDAITYKMRHIYGGQAKDFRGWDKSVVA